MADAVVIEMQSIVRKAAEPWAAGDTAKVGILRASRRCKLAYRRARSFWYASAAMVRAEEADRMRQVELQLLAERRMRLEHELATIQARLESRGKRVGYGEMGISEVGMGVPRDRVDVQGTGSGAREAGVSSDWRGDY